LVHGLMGGQRLRPGEHGIVFYRSGQGGRVTAFVYFRQFDGRRARLQATETSKTAARRAVMDQLGGILDAGPPGAYDLRTLVSVVADDWVAGFEEMVESGRRSPSTLALYRHALDRHVLSGVGSLTLGEASTLRLDYFLTQLRRTKGHATARLCRAVLSGVCGLAVRRGGIRVNPVREVSTLERDPREARALTVNETFEWLSILDADPFAVRKDLPDLTSFLLGTGCRIGEAVGVHWDDLDLDSGILHVRRTIIRIPGQGMLAKPPKSRAGERVLRPPDWLVNLLTERRAQRPDRVVVFPDARGGYRDRNNVERDYRQVRADTPYKWVLPHSYRKTVATMLDAQWLSARMIADQLGHSRVSMTQDVYLGRRTVDPSVAEGPRPRHVGSKGSAGAGVTHQPKPVLRG
jgi:integrase